MRIRPTIADQQVIQAPGGGTQNAGLMVDASLLTPDRQTTILEQLLAAGDELNPAPDTVTPPWGESIPLDEYTPEGELEANYLLAPDLQANADVDLHSIYSEAFGDEIPTPDWENDPQYFGLGVPPGVPNYNQPNEGGRTQAMVFDPSAEYGMLAWSGKSSARVARHENMFTGYNAGTSRGHNINVRELQDRNAATYMAQRQWQRRNMMMVELQRRGIHGQVVTPVPAQTYTEQVMPIDPYSYPQAEIGPEGVLP